MENREYIRELLAKYLEGLTSLEEEKFLKEYLSRADVPEEFSSEAQWFLHTGNQNVKDSDIRSLEMDLGNWVDRQEQKEKNMRLRSWAMGIAAGIAILAASLFFFNNFKKGKVADDTYTDPQIAYLEAQKVLMYVSQTLNKGTEKLHTVSRIEEGASEMSVFSTFGSGLKNLELISKYDETVETKN